MRDGKAIDIIKKVENNNFESLSNIISSRKPFGLGGTFTKSKDFHKDVMGINYPIKCYGKAKSIGFVEKELIITNNNWIDKWKVMMPYANNIGTELNDDNLNAFVGEPNSICIETFLIVGAESNLNQESANNLCRYLKTKCARFLHSLSKISQHATAKTYKFVPLQNFTNDSDVDWSKSIHKIDMQLYKKYNLTEDEISYIESKIKEMK